MERKVLLPGEVSVRQEKERMTRSDSRNKEEIGKKRMEV